MKEDVQLLTGALDSTADAGRADEEQTTGRTPKKARCPKSSSNCRCRTSKGGAGIWRLILLGLRLIIFSVARRAIGLYIAERLNHALMRSAFIGSLNIAAVAELAEVAKGM